ncbi:ketopantoate reductase family protein [Burkholderia multivorans]|uniref:2-dehydropantoate 2-reductase n=1 Tax=Burkholderia multivorans (strain ATCC 17616 / 249) TaxID=395019 RepID=A0A0H3KGX2_BURM1|nr:2-dehydropantoate 2-reductase [Burkholderia multivorans]ABX14411.1 2-dehydropantoate 2-reductase [Burkholderia multivorans ATCC 17616]MBU9466786.1 2-dehydropantoate 2-reductase [Burkholderia multivorans]MCA8127853.1 2-dehydropantoate 2-reductase [Burkholderia multivorans]PRF67135.1 2-dehydropantoate 2-reductase [Burkholderia multivorans]BAG44435.1 2-dehydropantoate 2-reductase [Burkholderia multivorans ATCC 17616]
MRIAILGAGAMGSLFGGLLAESGEDVTLIDVNDAHLDAIRRDGLRIDDDRGERHITTLQALRPEAANASADTPSDLLIVFTKSLHTRVALDGVRALLTPHTHVLTLQNGLGNVETLNAFVPLERILVGVTTWPADLAGPAHVLSHGAGTIRMMTADGAASPFAAAVADALSRAGLACTLDADVWAAIWEKVAFNAALNTLCAVTRRTVDQLGEHHDGPRLAHAIVAETAAVARAKGIAVDAARIARNVEHAIREHRGHRPSMLQDVLAGRRTEIDAIGGKVVAAAREVGLAVPHTETMLSLVRVIDAQAG